MDHNSTALRTVVRGGRIITMDGELRTDLVIDDHVIVAMLADSSGVEADNDIDATDLLLLPGAVETWFPAPWMHDIDAGHLPHLQQAAALAGGITSVAAEPGNAPGDVGTPSHLSVDAAIWLPVVADSIPSSQQIGRMKQVGVIGVSTTLAGQSGLTDAELYQLMQGLATHGLPLAIQPLHGEIRARDPLAESLVTSTLMLMAEATGAWVHLHGVTTAEAVRIAIDARERGVSVTISVPALYLANAAESGRSLRIRPPFRPRQDIDELWQYVLTEQIDCIGITPMQSVDTGGIVTDAQTAFSLFWHEAVSRRGMSTSQAVRMTAINPSQILGLFPQKGTLRIGSDADLIFFDPDATWSATNEDVLDGSGLSPIHGDELRGIITRVLSHGRTVYDLEHHTDDSLVIPGTGRILHRSNAE